jgi:hypothetical protein
MDVADVVMDGKLATLMGRQEYLPYVGGKSRLRVFW